MEGSNMEVAAFEDLWKAVQLLQEAVDYPAIEALGETLQNLVNGGQAQQVDGLPSTDKLAQLNKAYQDLSLDQYQPEQIRRMIQYTFLKAAKEDGLQTNHQMTPDGIGLLLAYMLDLMTKGKDHLVIGDLAAGAGNLLSTILIYLQGAGKTLQAYGVDNDEVLTHMAVQAYALEDLQVTTTLQDGLSHLMVEPLDIAVSDLPVGYYPVDHQAQAFKTHVEGDHSYAHHLLIEQHLNYLKPGGLGLFIVPSNLFDSPQAGALLDFLQDQALVQAMLEWPPAFFKATNQKSLLIVQKKGGGAKQVSQVLLGQIPEYRNREKFAKFTQTFEKWSQEML